jgi:S1-C subfamily serine protease
LVVTTADALAGSTVVQAITALGRWTARVVGIDRAADVALLDIGRDLPVPTFNDDSDVDAGQRAMVVAPTRQSSPSTAVAWAPVTIASVGTTVRTSVNSMAAIGVTTGKLARVSGELLVQPGGGVIGMLANAGKITTSSDPSGFVPASLLTGVSADLAHGRVVHHGWLDVKAQDVKVASSTTRSGGATSSTAATSTGGSTSASNTTPSTGAVVVSVNPKGAAAGKLRVGDVIDSVGGEPVRSVAELKQRLYIASAGQLVTIGVRRDGADTTAEVDLGSSP